MDDINDFDRRAGTRIKLFREDAQMSQSELLSRLHAWGLPLYTQAQMSHWETGRRTLSLREAHTIAAILGGDLSALLEGTEDLDIAVLDGQQHDALAAIIERQEANAERLADMNRRRAVVAEHQSAIAELDRQIRSAGAEIDRYQAVVRRTEQRLADLNDAHDEHDDEDNGYEEI